jgi:ABC-type Fe3+/spermidine/putrescine transport system ATPase subunit
MLWGILHANRHVMTDAVRSCEPVLRVRGLAKNYGTVPAVKDVSFDLNAGEVLTLLGPSGCGKSTTLRLVAGLEQPDTGEVRIRDRLVASAATGVMVAPEGRRVGLVFQSYAIWPHMTVADNIAYPLKARRIDRATIMDKVAKMVRVVKLDGLADRMPAELSGGQQQRVALARALVYEPDLLLLDEPLSNLDQALRKEMRSQLKTLQSRLATTMLYVTHDQEEAMSLSSRVAVMNGGVIEQIGPPTLIYEEPATRFVQHFVGRTITLRGLTEGDGQRVRIGNQTIAAGAHATVRPGTAVEVSTRPEHVQLLTKCDARENCLAGKVVEVTYYGDRLEYTISVDETDELVVVDAEKRQRAVPGDRVFLGMDEARIRLWPL